MQRLPALLNRKKWILIPAFIVFIAILAVIGLRMKNEIESTEIADQLKALGVPVRDVTTISLDPFQIAVDLLSTSDNSSTAPEDNWYMMLTIRVVSYNFRNSTRVDSFAINVFNTKGEKIYSLFKKINPQDPDQLITYGKSKLDNKQTMDLVSQHLNLGGLTLKQLQVLSMNSQQDSGQILNVKVSAKDIADANQYLPDLFRSFLRILYTGNKDFGIYIVLGHFQLVDAQNNSLLDFARENESGEELWTEAPGLWNGWHSRGPAFTDPSSQPICAILYMEKMNTYGQLELFDRYGWRPSPGKSTYSWG